MLHTDYQKGMGYEGVAMGRRGKVLVMDDEEVIRELAEAVLLHAGFDVDTASCGQEAIDLTRQSFADKSPHDIAILDLVLQEGIDGEATLAKLHEINPALKAVACSGKRESDVMRTPREFGFSGSLPKPYRSGDLVAIVSDLADQTATAE